MYWRGGHLGRTIFAGVMLCLTQVGAAGAAPWAVAEEQDFHWTGVTALSARPASQATFGITCANQQPGSTTVGVVLNTMVGALSSNVEIILMESADQNFDSNDPGRSLKAKIIATGNGLMIYVGAEAETYVRSALFNYNFIRIAFNFSRPQRNAVEQLLFGKAEWEARDEYVFDVSGFRLGNWQEFFSRCGWAY